MRTITMQMAVAAYRAGNNAGNGQAPDGDDIDAAVASLVAAGGEVLLSRRTSDDVAVVRCGEEIVAIGGDSGGAQAWAVDITQAVQS